MTKDESVGWHHRLDGPEFEQTLGVGDGQGSLACYSPWFVQKELDKKEMPKSKMAVWGGLKIAVKRREVKSKGEKERYKHLNAELQRLSRRDKKAVFSDQCKEIEENNRMGKTRDCSRILEISREHFMQRWAQ